LEHGADFWFTASSGSLSDKVSIKPGKELKKPLSKVD